MGRSGVFKQLLSDFKYSWHLIKIDTKSLSLKLKKTRKKGLLLRGDDGVVKSPLRLKLMLKEKTLHEKRLKPEATMGFEPMIRVLQTLALPLGHVAIFEQAGLY